MDKPFEFNELSPEQGRQIIDVRQVFAALESARQAVGHRFMGSMAWKTVEGRDYLYRRRGRVERSLGARSTETEAVFHSFTGGKAEFTARAATLTERLAGMAPVNRALGLGRVPRLIGRILRRLDLAGLGSPRSCVVGTNALFAYEAAAAVQLHSAMLSTGDVDIALDRRRKLSILSDGSLASRLGMLRQVDRSFAPLMKGDNRAANRDGFMVEFIEPAPKQSVRLIKKAVMQPDDLGTAELWKLQWIVEAPRFSEIVIGDDGLPFRLDVPDPRWFAAHKRWLAFRADRASLKRKRDLLQAETVAYLVGRYMPMLKTDEGGLASLPDDLRSWLAAACEDAKHAAPGPEW